MNEPGETANSEQFGLQVVEKIFGTARASAVFSEPVTTGAYTVITASEVTAGGGFGSGHGFGPVATGDAPATGGGGGGGGAGGGGGSSGRPVAVIVVGPDGVQVKPIFDLTKVGLAVLTAWAAMLMTLIKVRRGMRTR
jgi:uncharacterized spore protein YtfJ